jgi:hypothetical protein
MKAIETVYAGYRFRSRLEARWAVFFERMGIPFEYEKEGYELPWLTTDGTFFYLPDFWIPAWRAWVEIKGEDPTEEELEKCQSLRDSFPGKKGKKVIMFVGDPMTENCRFFRCTPDDESPFYVSVPFILTQCSNCGMVWATKTEFDDWFTIGAGERCPEVGGADCWQRHERTPLLTYAMGAARKAQFTGDNNV